MQIFRRSLGKLSSQPSGHWESPRGKPLVEEKMGETGAAALPLYQSSYTMPSVAPRRRSRLEMRSFSRNGSNPSIDGSTFRKTLHL